MRTSGGRVKEDDGPAPGSYQPAPPSDVTPIRGPFAGTQPRIPKPTKGVDTPGPGEYYIPSTIQPAAPSLAPPPGSNTGAKGRIATAPSIPCAAQCYGYEEGAGGDLVMQRPAKAGFRGEKGDTVGPMYVRASASERKEGAAERACICGRSRLAQRRRVLLRRKRATSPGGCRGETPRTPTTAGEVADPHIPPHPPYCRRGRRTRARPPHTCSAAAHVLGRT
jgi:hypothetical protein